VNYERNKKGARFFETQCIYMMMMMILALTRQELINCLISRTMGGLSIGCLSVCMCLNNTVHVRVRVPMP